MQSSRVPRSLIAFTVAYVVGIGAFALSRGSRELVIYLSVIAVLSVAIVCVHRRCRLSQGLLWCFSVWGLLHMAGGLVRIPQHRFFEGQEGVLYSLALVADGIRYDQVVHAFGFGTATWFCWEALSAGVRNRHGYQLDPTPATVALCALAGMGFGALNEVVEFVATLTLPETNVGGYLNTGWDLVYNTVGALAASTVVYLKGRAGGLRCSNRGRVDG